MPSLFPGRGHGSWVQTAPTVPADASPIPRRSFMQTSDITMKVSLPENIASLMSGLMRTRQPFDIIGPFPHRLQVVYQRIAGLSTLFVK